MNKAESLLKQILDVADQDDICAMDKVIRNVRDYFEKGQATLLPISQPKKNTPVKVLLKHSWNGSYELGENVLILDDDGAWRFVDDNFELNWKVWDVIYWEYVKDT